MSNIPPRKPVSGPNLTGAPDPVYKPFQPNAAKDQDALASAGGKSSRHRRTRQTLVRPEAKTGDFDVPNRQKYRRGRMFSSFSLADNQQGWKIHIPAPSDYELSENYKSVFEHLQNKQVPHKYVTSRDAMRTEMNTTETQVGKFLTIYPDDEEQMLQVIRYIDRTLNSENFYWSRPVPGEKHVGTRSKIFARYGAFTSSFIVKPELADQEGANRDVKNYTLDRRSKKSYKPVGIRDPFVKGSTGASGWIPRDVRLREKRSWDGTMRLEIIEDGDKGPQTISSGPVA